jgi:P-loop ATPase
MNYFADRPINSKDEDLLKRAVFSEKLGDAISAYSGEECLVIGLYGSWGTGKTSIINMALKSINQSGTNKPIVMRFSPWNYTDQNDLISIFFASLYRCLVKQNNEEIKKKVGEALCKYSEAFAMISKFFIGNHSSELLKSASQSLGQYLMNVPDLEKEKENLEKQLRGSHEKIIVVIDDIDRLSNTQIKDIFQLVKQVADFPNVIYILAMDRDIVCNALDKVQNYDGQAYLDKIIQIPFEVPVLRKSVLENIFKSKLKDIVREINENDIVKIDEDTVYWKIIYQNCVEPYMNTLRDMIRFINTFQFKYSVLYKETLFEDLVGITALEVLEPNLYKWIYQNKKVVCHALHNANNAHLRQRYTDEFNILKVRSKLAIKAVASLFPMFADSVQESFYQPIGNLKGQMRIADNDKFDTYFIFTLEEIKVPRDVIKDFIEESDEKTLKIKIDKIINEDNIHYFLQELESLLDEIPQHNIGKIASVLLDINSEIIEAKSDNLLRDSISDDIEALVFDYLIPMIINDEERYELIKSKVEIADATTLGTIARLMVILKQLNRRGGDHIERKYIASLDKLKQLENIFKEKIRSIKEENNLLDMEGFSSIFFVWESIDQQDSQQYLASIFKHDEANKLKFICIFAEKCNDSNGKTNWKYDEERYSKYISKKEIFDLINNDDISKKIKEFSKEIQNKLTFFSIHYYGV